ncbi:hypothetical protein D3C73_1260350 [compost metagenome]
MEVEEGLPLRKDHDRKSVHCGARARQSLAGRFGARTSFYERVNDAARARRAMPLQVLDNLINHDVTLLNL